MLVLLACCFDLFGHQVEVLALPKPGRAAIVASDPLANSGTVPGCGQVWVFDAQSKTIHYSISGTCPGSGFGQGIVQLPDVDGDAIAELVVAARDLEGAEYLTILSGKDGKERAKIDARSGGLRFPIFAVCDDQDGDAASDFCLLLDWVSKKTPKLRVVSGRTGKILQERALEEASNACALVPVTGCTPAGLNVVALVVPWHATYADGSRDWGGDKLLRIDSSKLAWSTEPPGKRLGFGSFGCASWDRDQDGCSDILVSCMGTAESGDAGLLAVSGATGSVLARWKPRGEWLDFGRTFRTVGDQDADGVRDIVVGAPGTDRGMVYVLSGRHDQLIQTLQGDPLEESHFGRSLAAAGDWDGDGLEDLLVGASSPGGHLSYDGAIWVISIKTGNILLRARRQDLKEK